MAKHIKTVRIVIFYYHWYNIRSVSEKRKSNCHNFTDSLREHNNTRNFETFGYQRAEDNELRSINN